MATGAQGSWGGTMEVDQPSIMLAPPVSNAPTNAALATAQMQGQVNPLAQPNMAQMVGSSLDTMRGQPSAPAGNIKSLADIARFGAGGGYQPTFQDGTRPPEFYASQMEVVPATIPSETKSTSWSRRTIDKAAMGKAREAQAKFVQAQQDMTKAIDEASRKKSEVMDWYWKQSANQQQKAAIQDAAILKERQDYLNKYKDEEAKINMTMDSSRVWSSKNVAQKAAFYIGGIMEGYLRGLGRDMGEGILGQYNREVDRDLMIQQRMYESKKEGLARKWNLYTAYRELGNDKMEAIHKSKAFYLNLVAKKAEVMAASSDDPIKKQRAMAAAAEFSANAEKQLAMAQTTSSSGQKIVAQKENPMLDILGKQFSSAVATSKQRGKFDPKEYEALRTSFDTVQKISAFSKNMTTARSLVESGKPIPQALRDQIAQDATTIITKGNKLDNSIVTNSELPVLTQEIVDLGKSGNLEDYIGNKVTLDRLKNIQQQTASGLHRRLLSGAQSGMQLPQVFYKSHFSDPESVQQYMSQDETLNRLVRTAKTPDSSISGAMKRKAKSVAGRARDWALDIGKGVRAE